MSIHVSSTCSCWYSLWNIQNQILQTLYDIFELDEISDSIGTDFAVWIIISFFFNKKRENWFHKRIYERNMHKNVKLKQICSLLYCLCPVAALFLKWNEANTFLRTPCINNYFITITAIYWYNIFVYPYA